MKGNLKKQRNYPLKAALSVLVAGGMLLGLAPAALAGQSVQPLAANPYETAAFAPAGAQVPDGWNSYDQDLSGDTNSIAGAQTVNVGALWGLDGKTLNVRSVSGDVRVKFTEFAPLDSGAYEGAFRTGADSLGSIAFLARYKDEANYVGVSIDSSTNWVAHYSKGLSARGNDPFAVQGPGLQPNTAYKVKIEYAGADVTVSCMQEGDTEYTVLGTRTMTGAYSTEPGTFAVALNPGS